MRGESGTCIIGATNWDAAQQAPRPTPACVWTFRVFWYGALVIPLFLGGPITRALAGSALLFGILADRDGIIRHVARFIGLAVAVYLAPDLGSTFGLWLAPKFSIPLLAGRVLGIVSVGLVIVFVAGRVGRGASRRLWRRGVLRGLDHVIGSLVGSGEGALLVALVCWTVTTIGQPLAGAQGRDGDAPPATRDPVLDDLAEIDGAIDADPAGRLLKQVNPLSAIPIFREAHQFATVVSDRNALSAAIDDPRMRSFTDEPAVRRHLDAIHNDPVLSSAVQNHDFGTILHSGTFRAMLDDAELFSAFADHWEDLRAVFEEQQVGPLAQSARDPNFRARLEAARQAAQRR